jgi:hypothetical protein
MIDVEKFAPDLATWGPIASRVVELQLERSRNARNARRLTTRAPQLDICCRTNCCVHRQGDAIVISCRGIVSRIDLVSTAMHFGGRRE